MYNAQDNEDHLKLIFGYMSWKDFLKKYWANNIILSTYADAIALDYSKRNPIPTKRMTNGSLSRWLKPLREYLKKLENEEDKAPREEMEIIMQKLINKFMTSIEGEMLNKYYEDADNENAQ